MEAQVSSHIPLAAKIAREFSNIPGLPHAEIEMAAQEALARAARAFDPAKGEFAPYAAASIRNALRDLHERQSRHHRHHIYDLDEAAITADSHPVARIERTPAQETSLLPDRVAFQESAARLETAMATLSPRLRAVVEGIRDGKSYSEIGSSMGISKQAAHKLAGAAIATLREKLAAMGLNGIDTLGLLKSGAGAPPAAKPCHPVDDFPPHP